jgi:hypothetical protein
MVRIRHNPRPRSRRGGTLGVVLLTLSLVGGLTVTTVVLAPRYLAADTPEPVAVTADSIVHQDLIESLAEIVGRSVGVLTVNERGPTPYVEMVLWLADDAAGTDGKPDVQELAVLSHSAILQTITIYRLAPDENAAEGPTLDLRSAPDFCNRWRAHPGVAPLVLARGVSDMRVERVSSAQDEWVAWGSWGGLQRLRLSLTWASDSVDGPDEASVLVDTVLFPHGAGGASVQTREASETPPGGAIALTAVDRRRRY